GVAFELRGATGVTSLPSSSGSAVSALVRAADALGEAVRTGRPHPCDAAFGQRVTEILARAEAMVADAAG
ncbi:gfo/Idh/MocA family oxidoreductase, partial [Streptomyces sp. W16]|nr:gfo/Idh/MocA family oxidoreductase [Streptomyces sp. W16]